MKAIFFLFIVLFLFVPLVMATDYSGDYEDRVIEDMVNGETMIIGAVKECVGEIKIDVDGDLEISKGEVNITDCERTREFNSKSERWECPCDNPFDIEVRIKKNTINKYDFDIDYSTSETVVVDDNNNGGGGGGGGGVYDYYKKKQNTTTKDLTVINDNKVLDDNVKKKEEVISGAQFPASDNLKTTEKIEPPKEGKTEKATIGLPSGAGGTIIAIVAIILMILGGVGILFFKVFFDTTGDDGFDEGDVDELVYDMEEEDQKVFDKTEIDEIIEKVEEPEMSDDELEGIVGELRKDDKPKKIKTSKKKSTVKSTVKDVDDILKHLDDD